MNEWKNKNFYLLCWNFLVLSSKRAKSGTKLFSFPSFFNFNFTRERPKFVYVPWPTFFLNRQQFQIELLLVCLLQKGDQKAGSFQNLRPEQCIEESLVVALSFDELAWCESLRFGIGEGWNDDLGVGPQEIISQNGEVSVEPFDAPLHRERINGDHLALLFHVAAQL